MGAVNLASSGHAPSPHTIRSYRTWIADWTAWCERMNRVMVPAEPETLADYVADLGSRGKGVPTMRQAVAAVRYLHASAGYEGQPATRLAGIVTKAAVTAGDRLTQSTPILLGSLRLMVDTCPVDTPRGKRDQLVLLLGWSAMLRRSDLAALRVADVVETCGGLLVGTVPVIRGSFPVTDPVQAWTKWMMTLSEQGITTGPLFRSVGQTGRIGKRITGDGINGIVHSAARRAGLTGAYTAHSLRSGGATAAYREGSITDKLG